MKKILNLNIKNYDLSQSNIEFKILSKNWLENVKIKNYTKKKVYFRKKFNLIICSIILLIRLDLIKF